MLQARLSSGLSLRQAPRRTLAAAQRRPSLPSRTAGRLVVRCQGESNNNDKKPVEEKAKLNDKMEVLLADLKKTGMDKKRAKEVLKKWQELGVNDPEQLRKLLVKRTMKPLTGLGFQFLLDALASAGGYWTANQISEAEPFPGQFWLQLIALFFGFYYVIQALLNLSVMGVVVLTTYKYGTNSTELLAAVQQLAGPSTGLNVLDRAQVAVNTLKVLQVLDEIAVLLKDLGSSSPGRSTLQNLSAYLTLNHARNAYSFDPSQYGMSEKEAGEVAYVFSTYDTNDDYRLDSTELKRLCFDLGKDLTDDEVKEALRILDTSKNGFIEFNEFCAWWAKIKPPVAMA